MEQGKLYMTVHGGGHNKLGPYLGKNVKCVLFNTVKLGQQRFPYHSTSTFP